MEEYIATFFSHFGATRFKKNCSRQGLPAQVMPVPRSLSSSCGTCVKYVSDKNPVPREHLQEIEQIVRIAGEDQYEVIYRAQDL
ncbi:MAG: DUF3343 domain-containing protein [Lachnospiraceae bacterium]|nr:DUF3343 domain-containing protein [Lachnospiraceae bacterium]